MTRSPNFKKIKLSFWTISFQSQEKSHPPKKTHQREPPPRYIWNNIPSANIFLLSDFKSDPEKFSPRCLMPGINIHDIVLFYTVFELGKSSKKTVKKRSGWPPPWSGQENVKFFVFDFRLWLMSTYALKLILPPKKIRPPKIPLGGS